MEQTNRRISKLPPLEDQTVKYAHLRYKAFPINPEDDDAFFTDVNLPTCLVPTASGQEIRPVAIFPSGGMTAAFKINPENNEAHVGLTKCSLLDLYHKAHGRTIAHGRFAKFINKSHGRFDTAFTVDLTGYLSDEDTSATCAIREYLTDSANDGTNDDIERDMSFIRAFVASKTKVPFEVELS